MPVRHVRYCATENPAGFGAGDGRTHGANSPDPGSIPVRCMKAECRSRAPASAMMRATLPSREDPALMQNDNIVVGDDLVEQVGRPQHADALLEWPGAEHG